jgi:predicted ATPase
LALVGLHTWGFVAAAFIAAPVVRWVLIPTGFDPLAPQVLWTVDRPSRRTTPFGWYGEDMQTPLVGRTVEREQLWKLWLEASEGSLRIATITGEAGIGKTRLATQLAAEVRADGAAAIYVRCWSSSGAPCEPWAMALRQYLAEQGERTRLVPELTALLSGARSTSVETKALFASVASFLAAVSERTPLLLVVDDLQLADEATLALLRHVLAADSLSSMMLLAVARDTETLQRASVEPFQANLGPTQSLAHIALSGLAEADAMALINQATRVGGAELGGLFASRVVQQAAGNPRFTIELLRHLAEVVPSSQRDNFEAPSVTVRDLLERRVEQLHPAARAVLGAAAVIGSEFHLDLLRAVVDVSDAELADALDEGLGSSLLREIRESPRTFAFAHRLVEATVYESLDTARRAEIHKRVAEALETHLGPDVGVRLGMLAGHWAAAVACGDLEVEQHTAKVIDYVWRAIESENEPASVR